MKYISLCSLSRKAPLISFLQSKNDYRIDFETVKVNTQKDYKVVVANKPIDLSVLLCPPNIVLLIVTLTTFEYRKYC